MFIALTETLSVAGQLDPADMTAAAAAGFTTVINNRPDGEAPRQPTGDAIAAAAAAAGLRYIAIPVDHHGLNEAQVAATAAELRASDGPVLAFCRSGTRSATLWALAAASLGDDADAIIAAAARGGYALGGMRPALVQLAARG